MKKNQRNQERLDRSAHPFEPLRTWVATFPVIKKTSLLYNDQLIHPNRNFLFQTLQPVLKQSSFNGNRFFYMFFPIRRKML